MPNYPGVQGSLVSAPSNASPIALHKGESAYLFGKLAAGATQLPINDGNVAFEAAGAAVQASIAVNLQTMDDDPAPGVSVEIAYSAAPGAGESIAVQEADTDADGFYITPSNTAYTVAVFGANNTARTDLIPTGGKFLRVSRTKGANAVSATVKVSRLG